MSVPEMEFFGRVHTHLNSENGYNRPWPEGPVHSASPLDCRVRPGNDRRNSSVLFLCGSVLLCSSSSPNLRTPRVRYNAPNSAA